MKFSDPNRRDVRDHLAAQGWRWCAADGDAHIWNARGPDGWIGRDFVHPPEDAVLPGRVCPYHRSPKWCACGQFFMSLPGAWCAAPWEHLWDGHVLDAVRDRWPAGWFLRPGLGPRAMLVLPAGSPVRTLRRRAREWRFVVGAEREAGAGAPGENRVLRMVSVEVGIRDLVEVLADYPARARVLAGLEADDGRRRSD